MINDNLNLNFENPTEIHGENFNWKNYKNFENFNGKFDLIFGADVLFFRNYHDDLINSLINLLRNEDSRVVLMAPNRDSTLDQFLEKITGKLNFEIFGLEEVEIFESVMEKARGMEEFDENKHGLKVLVLWKVAEEV